MKQTWQQQKRQADVHMERYKKRKRGLTATPSNVLVIKKYNKFPMNCIKMLEVM